MRPLELFHENWHRKIKCGYKKQKNYGHNFKKNFNIIEFCIDINKNKIDINNDNNPLFEPEARTAVNMTNVINILTIFLNV